jgi:hypothetical protein
MGIRTGRYRRPLLVVAIAVATFVAAAPVAAVQYQRETHYDDTDAFSYGDCGFDVSVEGHYWGTFAMREGTGPDAGAFFGRNRYAFAETHTRVSSGVSITVSGHGQFVEVKGTRIDGSVFEFSAVNAGTFTIADASGKVVARDAGNVRESILFDTLGDDVPGGGFIAQTFFRVDGPHPSGDVDWCALFG